MMLGILSRSTSRLAAGEALSRNEKWLETVKNYTIDVGITIILLRPFPKFLRPLVARILPSVHRLNKQLAWVKNELFVPMINGRRYAEHINSKYEKPDDYLQWMMDLADNPDDKEPEFMAHNLFIIMSLAFVHTSTMLITHLLFDLVDKPQYLEPLREEIRETRKDGWSNGTQASFFSQHRMDSFMKEVQRFNPTAESKQLPFSSLFISNMLILNPPVSMNRIARQCITLSDGLVIPQGTHICFASGPLARDPDLIPQPQPFDGLRWSLNTEDKTNSFVSIGPTNMHFGFGRQACPGRFFAAYSIKAIMSRLLMEYDFKLADGQKKRPRNIRNGEQIMPNVWATLLIRKRRGVLA